MHQPSKEIGVFSLIIFVNSGFWLRQGGFRFQHLCQHLGVSILVIGERLPNLILISEKIAVATSCAELKTVYTVCEEC